jgi:hypothetical protein
VKIGNDTTFCAGNIETGIQLAPYLSVNGGIAPYKYCWSKSIPYEYLPDRFYYAGSCLNDTTLANPLFINQYVSEPNTWSEFVLTIEDSEGNIAKDSINVRFSEYFAYTTLTESPIYVKEGDSLLLDIRNENWGGILPYTNYAWNPQDGLSNPNSPQTWCKPEKETCYSCVLTDSVGCAGYAGSAYWIIVSPSSSISSVAKKSNIYQWKGNIHFDNAENKEAILSFYDSSGKLIYETATRSDNYRPSFNTNRGYLFCTIKIDNKQQTIKYLIP